MEEIDLTRMHTDYYQSALVWAVQNELKRLNLGIMVTRNNSLAYPSLYFYRKNVYLGCWTSMFQEKIGAVVVCYIPDLKPMIPLSNGESVLPFKETMRKLAWEICKHE